MMNFGKSVGLSGEAISFLPFKINAMTIYHIVNDINWLMQYRVTKQQQVKFICKYTILTSIEEAHSNDKAIYILLMFVCKL